MACTQYQKEVSARAYARKKALAKGEPVPEWARKKPKTTPEEKRQANTIRQKRYREKHQSEINARTQRRRDSLQSQILPYKDQPCMDCGQRFPPVCMDFDHRDPSEKIEPVATLLTNCKPIEVILLEVAKCDIVCSNCHRIRTFITKKGNNG